MSIYNARLKKEDYPAKIGKTILNTTTGNPPMGNNIIPYVWRVNINGDIRNVSVVILEDKQHNRYYTLDAVDKKKLPYRHRRKWAGSRGAKR